MQEAEWRVRFANAREQVSQAEAACWHEVVRMEYYQGIPVQMKVKEFVESEESSVSHGAPSRTSRSVSAARVSRPVGRGSRVA